MSPAVPLRNNETIMSEENGAESSSPSPPPPLRFSSYSLLEGGDLAAGSLGLPTGALLSPFAHLDPPPARIPRQPILCTFCAAYPNPFCTVDSATGGWRCCFCENDNPCYAEDFIGSSPSEHRESYPEMTYKTVEYSERDLAGFLSGMSELTLATGPHRRRDRAACAPAHVFVVDGNMRGDALVHLAHSVEQVLTRSMEPEALVALVVFTGVVSVYHLGKMEAAVADVFPGDESTPQEDMERQLAGGERDHFVPVHAGKGALCTILKLLRGVGDGTVRTNNETWTGSGESRNGYHGNGGVGVHGDGPRRRTWARRVPVPAHRRKRCLGVAVEYALSLAATAERLSSRLMVCLGGCPNYGPGAVAPCLPGPASTEVDPEALAAAAEYFEALGVRALEQGTGVDVFCGGSEGLGAAALHALTSPTGGYVVIQPSFTEQEFASNLTKSVREQAMSHGDGLNGCVIDARASAGMSLLHVIGPAEATHRHDDVDKEAEQTSMAAARTAEGKPAKMTSTSFDGQDTNKISGLGGTYHRLVVGRVDPRTSLAFYYEGPGVENINGKKKKAKGKANNKRRQLASNQGYDEDELEYVMFQFVVRHSRGGEGRVTRVMTHRLPVTRNEDGFLQTVDPEAVAVLVGKEAVLRATYGNESGINQEEVEEARLAVDTVIHEVSQRYRDLLKRKRLGNGSNGGDGRLGGGTRRRWNYRSSTSGNYRRKVQVSSGEHPRSDDEASLGDAEGGDAGRFVQEGEATSGTHQSDPEMGDQEAYDDDEDEDDDVFGQQEGPEVMVFPRELGWLPTQLFHLRRGPLLGPLLQNSDDPVCLRHLFLRGALEECIRMMAPDMFSLKASEALAALLNDAPGTSSPRRGEAEPRENHVGEISVARAKAAVLPIMSAVPVETLAMLADRILVLDTHDRIFVWSGADVCGKEFEPVREACLRIFSVDAANRYPAAAVVFLKDGSSWSRYLTSRLIPSHKDPVEDQIKGFPGLAELSEAELERLRSRFLPTDDESFREFFWDVCTSSSSAW